MARSLEALRLSYSGSWRENIEQDTLGRGFIGTNKAAEQQENKRHNHTSRTLVVVVEGPAVPAAEDEADEDEQEDDYDTGVHLRRLGS
jgi:hypothetical protein